MTIKNTHKLTNKKTKILRSNFKMAILEVFQGIVPLFLEDQKKKEWL